jgi:cyclopropane fatty-acyl-phospholipid synthase-like methyltransferase
MDLHYLSHLAALGATDLHPEGRRATEALIRCLQLNEGQRVLEIGCGAAGTLARIALSHPVRVDGLDVLPEMLHVAETRLRLVGVRGQAHLVRSTPGATLPFADATYDRAYAESVLGFQDAAIARAMLAEVFRVLKRGGRVVANEAIWKRAVSQETVARINQANLADFGLRLASEHAWGVDDWLHLMAATGFSVVSADLLERHTANARESPAAPLSWRLALSDALTRYYRVRGWLIPGVRVRRARYRKLLERHRADGQYIESRLFVLGKP